MKYLGITVGIAQHVHPIVIMVVVVVVCMIGCVVSMVNATIFHHKYHMAAA
jgi:hypothetical protein